MSDTFTLHVITDEGVDIQNLPSDPQFNALGLSMPRIFRRNKAIQSDKLIESWKNTNKAIGMMMSDAEEQETEKGLRLNEITVTLDVSAEGTIGFVSGTAEAGVVLKFSRD